MNCSGDMMMLVLIKFQVWVIKLYGDKNEWLFRQHVLTYLEYLTTKEILFDWKQSAEGLDSVM